MSRARIRELLSKATPEPWTVGRDMTVVDPVSDLEDPTYVETSQIGGDGDTYGAYMFPLEYCDARLIVALRNNATALLDCLDACEEAIRESRAALLNHTRGDTDWPCTPTCSACRFEKSLTALDKIK